MTTETSIDSTTTTTPIGPINQPAVVDAEPIYTDDACFYQGQSYSDYHEVGEHSIDAGSTLLNFQPCLPNGVEATPTTQVIYPPGPPPPIQATAATAAVQPATLPATGNEMVFARIGILAIIAGAVAVIVARRRQTVEVKQ